MRCKECIVLDKATLTKCAETQMGSHAEDLPEQIKSIILLLPLNRQPAGEVEKDHPTTRCKLISCMTLRAVSEAITKCWFAILCGRSIVD